MSSRAGLTERVAEYMTRMDEAFVSGGHSALADVREDLEGEDIYAEYGPEIRVAEFLVSLRAVALGVATDVAIVEAFQVQEVQETERGVL